MIDAQSIGEPGTQLTMRTFHVGGTAQIKEESQIISQNKGKLRIINKNLIEDSKKNIIVMGRNTELSIEDDNNIQLGIYKVLYGSKLFFKDGDMIEKGKKIAEWDPYTLPVIAETSGIVNYMDLVEGTSLTETMDDSTGIASKSVNTSLLLYNPSTAGAPIYFSPFNKGFIRSANATRWAFTSNDRAMCSPYTSLADNPGNATLADLNPGQLSLKTIWI